MSDAVGFARLEGKIDVLNERQQYMATSSELANTRLNAHSDRITALESTNILVKGEKIGTRAVVRALWAILGVLLTGGLATLATVAWALMRAFGK